MEKTNKQIVSSEEIWSVKNMADVNRYVLGFANGDMLVKLGDSDFLDAYYKISGKSNLSAAEKYKAVMNVCDQILANNKKRENTGR